MLGVALTLFALAAIGGVTMAVLRLRGMTRPPSWLAVLHGLLAISGLGFLGYEAATTSLGTLALAGAGAMVLAALGGATLFLGFDLQGKALPIPFVLGHGLIAVTGFILLAIYHYKMHEWGLRP